MNLVLEIVASKKSLKLTLQQVIQRVKTEEDSSSLPKLHLGSSSVDEP